MDRKFNAAINSLLRRLTDAWRSARQARRFPLPTGTTVAQGHAEMSVAGLDRPRILLIAPPRFQPEIVGWGATTEGGLEKSWQLAKEYSRVAAEKRTDFLDASEFALFSPADGFHIDVDAAAALGRGVAAWIRANWD